MFNTARIVLEEMVLYVLSFYLVSSIIFNMGIMNSFLPNQCYNSTSTSLEYCDTTPAPSIFGNTNDLMNETLAGYGSNSSEIANPGAMLDPTGIVKMVGFYITFMFTILGSTYLTNILTIFVGASWAHVMTFIFNICAVIISIRIISGRIRWD